MRKMMLVLVVIMITVCSSSENLSGSMTKAVTIEEQPMIESNSSSTFNEIRIDSSSLNQNETAICFNPLNPDNLVACFNDFRLGDFGVGYGFSTDGGNTWVDNIITSDTLIVAGDPSIVADLNGNFYIGMMAAYETTSGSGSDAGMYVARSTDGGRNWNDPIPVFILDEEMQDKPYLAIDNSLSIYQNRVYMLWTSWGSQTGIVSSYSEDQGLNFSDRVVVSDPGSSGIGVSPVVGSDGALYVAWIDYPQYTRLILDKSMDGGLTFGTDTVIDEVTRIGTVCPDTNRRSLKDCVKVNSFPSLGVDTSNGFSQNNLYVTWADQRSGDPDILFSRSTDKGETWSDPIRVNDDNFQNGIDQFFPWIAVNDQGYIFITFYDSRNDPDNWLIDTYLAFSTDGGISFLPNVRVSSISFDATVGFDGQFFGDYNGITATTDYVYPCWTDSRNQNQDIYVAPIEIDSIIFPQEFDYQIFTNQRYFHENDEFILKISIRNGLEPVTVDQYIMLDISGHYWFWPSWKQELDFEQRNYQYGITEDVILEFVWPLTSGSLDGIKIWLGCTEPSTYELVGQITYTEFGYR